MAVPFVSVALAFPLGLSLAGEETAALHFIGGAVEVFRLAIDALGFQGPVVDSRGDPGLVEGRVHGLGPGGSPTLQNLLSVPVPGFVPKSAVLEGAEGEEYVGVGVPLVGVDSHVGDHSLLDTVGVHPSLQEPDVVGKVQLIRKGELEFPGELGVLALLGGLHSVPEGSPVLGPGGSSLGSQDDLVRHGLTTGVIPGHPLPMVGEHVGRSIGRRRHGGPAGAAADDLGGESVDGHEGGRDIG